MADKKVKVIIKVPVACSGEHYAPSDKPVPLSEDDARFLLVRGKAEPAGKPSKPAD